MNLIRKISLIIFMSVCACAQTIPPIAPCTPSTLVQASWTSRIQMLSGLLKDERFSDADIARILDVTEQDVKNARVNFGPLELDELLALITKNYDAACYTTFNKRIIKPVAFGALLIAVECGFFCGMFGVLKLFEENIRLKAQLKKLTK